MTDTTQQQRSSSGQPRIRTLKPETWQDESVGALDIPARHLRTVLITMADDEGRFRALPAAIVGFGYPYDESITLAKVKKWLAAIESTGMIVTYEVDGIRYGYFPKWKQHQRINRPSPSLIPAPPGHDDSLNGPGSGGDGSRSDQSPPRGGERSRIGSDQEQERNPQTPVPGASRSQHRKAMRAGRGGNRQTDIAALQAVVSNPSPEAVQAWPEVIERARSMVGDDAVGTWLDPLQPISLTDDGWVVTSPAALASWVRDRFQRVLDDAAGCTVEVIETKRGAA